MVNNDFIISPYAVLRGIASERQSAHLPTPLYLFSLPNDPLRQDVHLGNESSL